MTKIPTFVWRTMIEQDASAAVAQHNLGPHSRLRIIERIASEEFPDDQWKAELGPAISDLLDQAKGDD